MDIVSWIKTTLSKYSSNNTHDKNAIYFVKNEDGKTGKIISDEVVYGNGGGANEVVVESPNQPTGGESVWVNPDEDPEEVEVYNRSQVDALLQGIVGSIASLSESGYLFSGVATSETDPGTPDAKVFYIANGKGTYEKFGGINVTEDDVVILYWDTAWHKVSTGIASQEKLSELDHNISGIFYENNNIVIYGDKHYHVNVEVPTNKDSEYDVHVKFSKPISIGYSVLLFVLYVDGTYEASYVLSGEDSLDAKIGPNVKKIQIRENDSARNETACTASLKIINRASIDSQLENLSDIPNKVSNLETDVYKRVFYKAIEVIGDNKYYIHADVRLDANYSYVVKLSLSEKATSNESFYILFFKKDGSYYEYGVPAGKTSLKVVSPVGTSSVQFRTVHNSVSCNALFDVSYQNSILNVSELANSNLLKQAFDNSVKLPACSFERDSYTIPNGDYSEMSVNSEQFISAISSLTSSSKLFLTLTEDVKVNTTIQIPSGASVIVNSNGFSLYEYHNENIAESIVNGLFKFGNQTSFGMNKKFISENGKNLFISRSDAYRSEAHTYKNDSTLGDAYRGLATITLPQELRNISISENDDVYICIRVDFYSCIGKVTGISDGVLSCKVLKGKNSIVTTYTKHPYFFFINYDCDNNGGIIIRNNYLYSNGTRKLSECTLANIINVEQGAFLKIENAKNISGGVNNAIYNSGTVVLTSCKMSSPFGNAITSTTGAHNFIKECTFENYNSSVVSDLYRKAYYDITHCKFKNIGLYGENVFAVFVSNSHAYVADNIFENINYGAICCGNEDNLTDISNTGYRLVERNIIVNSYEYLSIKNKYGLFDGGAIYVGCNNIETTVRYNTILRFGDTKDNNGIYCDDGAYNVKVYGNVISGVIGQDITSRYESRWDDINSETGKKYGRVIPEGYNYCTNNFIAYNIFDGSIKLQANTSVSEHSCTYHNNVNVAPGSITESIVSPNINNTGIIYDKLGYIDASGCVKSSTDYKLITNNL